MMNITDRQSAPWARIQDSAAQAKQLGLRKLNEYRQGTREHAAYEEGWYREFGRFLEELKDVVAAMGAVETAQRIAPWRPDIPSWAVAIQGAPRAQPPELDPQAVIDHVENALREQAARGGISIEGLEP